jgi:hypothetical protein
MIADQTLLVIFGAAGFVINIVVLTVGGIMALSRAEASIRETINDHRAEIEDEFVRVRKEVGETTAAIRQKVTEVELWGRDNFVKKETFTQVTERFEKSIQNMGDRLETRLLRMESKIDKQSHD